MPITLLFCVCIDGNRQRRRPNRRLPVRGSSSDGAHLKAGLYQAPWTRREEGQQTPYQGCRGEWGRKLDIILTHKMLYTNIQPNQHDMYELTCYLIVQLLTISSFYLQTLMSHQKQDKAKQNCMFSSIERSKMDYCLQLKSDWAD